MKRFCDAWLRHVARCPEARTWLESMQQALFSMQYGLGAHRQPALAAAQEGMPPFA